MKVTFTDIDQQSVNGRTARAVNRSTGEVHTVTIAGGEADFGQLTYQQAYEVYGVTASGARVTQVLVKTETNEPEPDLEAPTSAPGGLTATAISASRIDLSWSALSGATSYEYRIDSGAAVSVGANTSAQATGLSAETQYSFQVRGRNAAGAGPWSSAVQATTQAALSGDVVLHLRASELQLQDTDPVTVVTDLSPSGNDFTSPSAPHPTFAESAINSMPAIGFGGKSMLGGLPVFESGYQYSLFIVAAPNHKYSGTDRFRTFYMETGDDELGRGGLYIGVNSELNRCQVGIITESGLWAWDSPDNSAPMETTHLFEVHLGYAIAEPTVVIDGQEQALSLAANDGETIRTSDGALIGNRGDGARPLGGDFGEIIVMRNANQQEISLARTSLASTYGVAI